MRAEVVAMTGECLNHEALKRAGEILKNGGLVAFPTETVYGLGGDALNPQASKKNLCSKGASFGQSPDPSYCRYGQPVSARKDSTGKGQDTGWKILARTFDYDFSEI